MKVTPIVLSNQPSQRSVPLFVDPVLAGFPNPARDSMDQPLDFNELLIRHPAATFVVRSAGGSMTKIGIGDGDLLVADKSLTARHGYVVIAAIDGEFVVKTLETYPKTKLVAMSDEYPDIELQDGQELEIWGVVTHCIKAFL